MNFGELQIYARQRIGIQQNDAIEDEELQMLLNMSMAELDLILCTDYEDYRVTTYLATIGSGVPSGQPNNFLPLPPDFFKLRGVDFGSPGQWITVYGFGLQQRNYFNNPYAVMFANYGNQVARKFKVMGNQIVIEPMNYCQGQYQVWYTPKFRPLDNPNDNLDIDMDTQAFIEYAIASTGVKVYTKLLLPTQSFESQMVKYEEMVRNGAKNRNSAGPMSMQNVRNRGGGFGWGGNFRGL